MITKKLASILAYWLIRLISKYFKLLNLCTGFFKITFIHVTTLVGHSDNIFYNSNFLIF